MTNLTTKNWVRCSLNQKKKTITVSTKIFKTKSEGELTLMTNQTHFHIMNRKGIKKLISEGWSVVDTKITNNTTKVEDVKEEWQPQYLVGGFIEEEIRSYVSRKKQKQAVHFVKGLHEINEKCKVSAVEVFGETKFKSEKPFDNSSAMDRYTKSQKRMKHFQESEVTV